MRLELIVDEKWLAPLYLAFYCYYLLREGSFLLKFVLICLTLGYSLGLMLFLERFGSDSLSFAPKISLKANYSGELGVN